MGAILGTRCRKCLPQFPRKSTQRNYYDAERNGCWVGLKHGIRFGFGNCNCCHLFPQKGVERCNYANFCIQKILRDEIGLQ